MTATTEYLIQGDQIVARDSFTRPVTNVAEVIKQLTDRADYLFSTVKLPPLLSKWTKGHYIGIDSNSSMQILLSEVEYFPLPNAYIRANGKLSFKYTSTDTPETKKPLVSGKWEFPNNYRVFILQFSKNGLRSSLSVQKPVFFVLKDNKVPLIPKFPNLYSCGNICAGPSYHERTYDIDDTLQAFKVGLDVLHTATPNFDLNTGGINTYMQYVSMEDQRPIVTDTIDMYKSATKYSIMEAVKWIITNKI